MLEVIARPPELEKTSEILTCSKILQDYFSELGSLILLLPTHAEILNILGSLHELLTRPKKAEVSAIKLEYLHKGAENSDLPVILARLSPICPPEIWRNLLEVVCDIVTISKTCCRFKKSSSSLHVSSELILKLRFQVEKCLTKTF